MEDSPQKLLLPDGNFIAYHKAYGKKNNTSVIFLGGFMSDMGGIKATSLEKHCNQMGYNFIRFDYFGHGQSSCKFTDCTIGIWKQNVLDVIDSLAEGKQVIVGSSMGGWLMLLTAMERPQRVAALIGIASAPDFTEDLIWDEMSAAQQAELQETGVFNLKSEYGDAPYPITLRLIEEARGHLLLRKNQESGALESKVHNTLILDSSLLDSNIPIRLIHGLKDEDVPASLSTRLAASLASNDVKVNLVEDGDHRMSTLENIKLLCDTLDEVAERIKNSRI